jgi:blue copper oxidase
MPNMKLTRRSTLLGMAGGLLAAPMLAYHPAMAATPKRLMMPKLDEGKLQDGLRQFSLSVAMGQTEFLPGIQTDTIGINADFLGPVLLLRANETARLNVTNLLSEQIALHWHGLNLPARMDGGPHQPIAPAATWQPEFPVLGRAGTYWYHAHQHGKTGEHVWKGMAGVIRVEDDEEASVPLPRSYGNDDFILVLQDRRFDAAGQIPYAPNMHDKMAGLQGDQMLVNGQIGPELSVEVPLIRLRVLNGSNGSIYRLHFADGRGFTQIASDGGLLASPVILSDSLLAPGERAEFLLDVSDGTPALLLVELFGAEAPFSGSNGIRDLLRIAPVRKWQAQPPLPQRLSELEAIPRQTGERRSFVLSMSGQGMMGDLLINGAKYDHQRIDFSVAAGSTETWVFENRTEMLHPMHVHAGQFHIVSRNGKPPPPQEAGLKDVVLTHPGEVVEVRMTFPDYRDKDAPYMLHCHILEHEDAGMMGQFTVV